MLNIRDQYVCDLIMNVLKASDTSLIFKEIKDRLPCEIDEMDLDELLFYLEEEGKIKQSRVFIPQGNFTAWSINKSK